MSCQMWASWKPSGLFRVNELSACRINYFISRYTKGATLSTLNPMYARKPMYCTLRTLTRVIRRKVSSSGPRLLSMCHIVSPCFLRKELKVVVKDLQRRRRLLYKRWTLRRGILSRTCSSNTHHHLFLMLSRYHQRSRIGKHIEGLRLS